MTTISREDALKVVQEQLDFLDEPMEKGTARLILKLVELIPESGSYTREQVAKAYEDGRATLYCSHPVLSGKEYAASLPAHGDGWISVEDRLPEVPKEPYSSVKVIVAWGNSPENVTEMSFARHIVRGKEVLRFMWIGRKSPWTITHWMPKPSPPVKQ